MKKLLTLLLIPFFISANANPAKKTMVCQMQGTQQQTKISFVIPNNTSILPKLNFSHPSEVTSFKLENGNLYLIAMDQADPERLRVAISAQYLMGVDSYSGQIIADFGSKEPQIDNGPVTCSKQ
jgi:hypothetical protein